MDFVFENEFKNRAIEDKEDEELFVIDQAIVEQFLLEDKPATKAKIQLALGECGVPFHIVSKRIDILDFRAVIRDMGNKHYKLTKLEEVDNNGLYI